MASPHKDSEPDRVCVCVCLTDEATVRLAWPAASTPREPIPGVIPRDAR